MELPEITVLAGQMGAEMVGKRVSEVYVSNEKCLNMPLAGFGEIAVGRRVRSVEPRGKWIFIGLDRGYTLLFNTGMGADVIHFDAGEGLPEKHQIRLTLDDCSGFTVRVWWFCYLHLVPSDKLQEHDLTRGMGMSPLDEGFTLDRFRGLLSGRRGGVKGFLMNQRNVAGIGNVYIQDILFGARLHPLRRIDLRVDEGRPGREHRGRRARLREGLLREARWLREGAIQGRVQAGAALPRLRYDDREDQDGVDGELHLPKLPAARGVTIRRRREWLPYPLF
jgi:formamidopyrimidine-DNA glycosylase